MDHLPPLLPNVTPLVSRVYGELKIINKNLPIVDCYVHSAKTIVFNTINSESFIKEKCIYYYSYALIHKQNLLILYLCISLELFCGCVVISNSTICFVFEKYTDLCFTNNFLLLE
jgi:hypothetical protein